MRRLMIPMVLLGGLTLCGAALAADSATGLTQVTYQGVKIAIDPVTGKMRAPTAAESRALSMKLTGGLGFKAVTRQQAVHTQHRIVGGGTSMKLPAENMLSVTATRQADGTVKVNEAKTQELPHE